MDNEDNLPGVKLEYCIFIVYKYHLKQFILKKLQTSPCGTVNENII